MIMDPSIRLSEVKIVRYRAAIDAGGDIAEISQWINEARAERLQAEASLRNVAAPAWLTRDEVKVMVLRAARAARIIQDADPGDKAAVYRD
jgi:hypothetical protein